MKMTQQETFDRVLRLWRSALHDKEQSWGPKFKAYYPFALDMPGLSWSLFLGETLEKKDLLLMEENFKKERPEIKKPFISIPTFRNGVDGSLLEELGYEKEKKEFYCFTAQEFSAPVLEEYTVYAGDFEDLEIFKDYSKMTIDIFKLSDDTIPQFNRTFNRELGRMSRILNFKKGEQFVGTACMSILDDICWLYGGSVYEAFRGKGTWRAMIRARQDFSKTLGAKLYFLQTAHPYLARNFESVIEIQSYRKHD
ncbi:MAG: GNAT family N-acetyltransferase [Bdellovibrionota bacterium]